MFRKVDKEPLSCVPYSGKELIRPRFREEQGKTMTNHPTSIRVTVDKSHVVVIGEKLYAESIELIRELVNNAYDADAEEVRVTVEPDRIEIEDNGSGMDYDGLTQYFNIGSPEKVSHDRSPVFHRTRIGMFGIGKFASLAAARRFEVFTRRGDFCARVVFDKDAWAKSGDDWCIPLDIRPADERSGFGTTVTLSALHRSFDPAEVEQRILTGTPLRAPHFQVLLNGHAVTPRSLTGSRLTVLEGCPFGVVHGEVVIVPSTAADARDMGIECRVRGVLVRRELFGMETWGREATRVRGEVNADFLPVTSDRSGFIIDGEEYRAFTKIMARVMGEVGKALGKAAEKKESRRAGTAVKEALQRIHHALARNPEFSPFGPIPYGGREPGRGGGAVETDKASGGKGSDQEVTATGIREAPPPKPIKKPKRRNPLLKRLTPDAVVKRMKFGSVGVLCVIDHFGPAGPEVFSEGSAVYINADHPLYDREIDSPRSFTMYVSRLLAQEIALMQDPRNPRKAFELQSRILREAFLR
jgi:hypothetical protein